MKPIFSSLTRPAVALSLAGGLAVLSACSSGSAPAPAPVNFAQQLTLKLAELFVAAVGVFQALGEPALVGLDHFLLFAEVVFLLRKAFVALVERAVETGVNQQNQDGNQRQLEREL